MSFADWVRASFGTDESNENAIHFLAAGTVDLIAADSGDDDDRPSFAIEAYKGGPLDVGFGVPVYVDLSDVSLWTPEIPIFRDHDAGRVLGQSKLVNIDEKGIRIEGVFTNDRQDVQDIREDARNGFKWRASIGAKIVKREWVSEDETAEVNGRKVKGPAIISRKSVLAETSILSMGADPTASTSVAANYQENTGMEFKQWLKAKGFDIETLDDAQKASLQAMFDAEQNEGGGEDAERTQTTAITTVNASGGTSGNTAVADDPIAQMRSRTSLELERQTAIQAAAGNNIQIAAQAIRDGWSVEKTELEVLRAARGTGEGDGLQVISRTPDRLSAVVIEAAIRLGSDEQSDLIESGYDEQTLDMADRHRRMSLRALIQAACAIDGLPCPSLTSSINEWVHAGFTTSSLSGILSNVAHKQMLSAFNAVSSVAKMIAKKLSASDFKQHTGYRLNGDSVMKPVGSGGELKSGNLHDSSFNFIVDTVGKIIALTRKQWINDDMGAFTQIPLSIGRGGMLALEQTFWDMVITNANTFFGTGNKNYISGADSALGLVGLDKAVQTLEEQVDKDKNPILVQGKYLIVPPALKSLAQRLHTSDTVVIAGDTDTEKPSANNHKGAYSPHSTPYLKSKSKEWYLFGDPADVAAFGIAYLNGTEAPTIEEAPLPSDCLGRAWRGFFDFGVCQIETQGAVKSKGES